MRGVARAVLAADTLLILLLTFAWPALAPDSRDDPLYRFAAVGAMWMFLAALAALLWEKACKAPRT